MSTPTTDLYFCKDIKAVPDEGTLAFYDGALYPARGVPIEPMFSAVYSIKRVLRESFKFPLLFLYNKKKLVRSFIEIAKVTVDPARSEGYILCTASKKIKEITFFFLVEIGIDVNDARTFSQYIAEIFENDNAYRYRVQDLATEVVIKDLIRSPITEINRVFNIYKTREDNSVIVSKFRLFVIVISAFLLIPKYRRAFKNSFTTSFNGLVYDRQDWYWVCQRGDYLYGGLTKEQRLKEFDIYPKLYTLDELQAMLPSAYEQNKK